MNIEALLSTAYYPHPQLNDLVWLRGHIPNAAGDSLFVTLNNQPAKILTGFTPRQWVWANTDAQGQPLSFEVLTPGVYTLHLNQREDGLRIDQLLLTTDSSYEPDSP